MKSSVGARLFSGFLVMILMTGLILVAGIGRLSHLEQISTELALLDISEIDRLWHISTMLAELDSDLQHLVLEGPENGAAHRVRDKMERLTRSLASYRDLQILHPAMDAEESRLLGIYADDFRTLGIAAADAFALADRGDAAGVRTLVAGRWVTLYRATVEDLNRLLRYEEEEAVQHAVRARRLSQTGQRQMIVLAVVALWIGAGLALVITRSLTRPIARLVRATERVAQGDWESRVEVVRDDEIGLLARRFNWMMDQLHRCLEEQKRFCADASHELRTPLTIVRGEAEVALRGEAKPEGEYRESLEIISSAASEMGTLVDELILLARSEAGALRSEMTDVDLAILLREVVHESQGLCTPSRQQVMLEVREPVVVRGEAHSLRRVFLALIHNAIRHSGTEDIVRVIAEARGGRVEIRVIDEGIGIPDEDLPHIFERFYRGRHARARPPGTGLGLAIARSIAEAHSGGITAESKIGVGTTLRVFLDAAPAPS